MKRKHSANRSARAARLTVGRACTAASLLFGFSCAASATSLLFEDTKIQASYPQVSRSPTWSLEAVVVRANDTLRHPLAAFIDGTPETNPRPMLYVARELARRGWTTVAVMRPGYGTSEGKEPPAQCGNFVSQAEFAAQTLRETLRVMSQRPYIDSSRLIAIGHSTGGLGAVALTAKPPANLAAAISFAGNNGSQYLNGKLDTVCNTADLLKAFATFGHASRIPTLWIYAENDHHMGPARARAYYDAFTGAGGQAVLRMAPSTPNASNGHQLYAMPDQAPIWTAYLDQFFSEHHLNLISPALDFAVPNIASPAGLTDSGHAGFANYLAAIPHKAFAMSRSHWGAAWLSDSTADAIKKAMANCKASDADPCKVVIIDDEPSR